MSLPLHKMIDIPPIWLAACLGLAWAIGPFGPEPNIISAGLEGVLVFIALVLIGLAALRMRQARTTIIPHLAPNALVTTGVFSISRNPIYLADVLILAGLSLRWGTYVGLLLVPVFMILIHRRFILVEEARLQRHFGTAFDEYMENTGRWL